MSTVIVNEDLRSVKTKKALYTAMSSLLKKQSFRKITIKKICEEALISRAAFYTHFIDKYDLLKHWMTQLWPKSFQSDTYEQIEKRVNRYIHENILILENLVYDADNEALGILFDYILSTMELPVQNDSSEQMHPKNVVLSNFYAGGIMNYFLWQVKNKFPPDVPPMNRYLYEIMNEFRDWQSNER